MSPLIFTFSDLIYHPKPLLFRMVEYVFVTVGGKQPAFTKPVIENEEEVKCSHPSGWCTVHAKSLTTAENSLSV
jgi:hypothetical protein